MNQILSVNTTNNKRSNKSSTKSILIVFSVILIIFGIGLTSTGAYSYYKNISKNSDDDLILSSNTKPIITIEREDASNINIVVTHDKELESVSYIINDEEVTNVEVNGQTEIKEPVQLSSGTSKVTINATDVNGVSASYESTFEVEQKPTIKLEQAGGNIQATIQSEINIDYVEYYWDDDTENATKLTINDIKTVTQIEVSEGTHTLYIKAVDIEGNEITKTQKVIGDNKPELTVKKVNNQVRITASDDESLSKIEITLNSNEMITEEITGNEYEKTLDLEDGENKIIITVYNKNGVSETKRVKCTKE